MTPWDDSRAQSAGVKRAVVSRWTLAAVMAIAALAFGAFALSTAVKEGSPGGRLSTKEWAEACWCLCAPGSQLSAGVVASDNGSQDPVQLESARIPRLDPDVALLGFTAHPYEMPGGVPLTAPGMAGAPAASPSGTSPLARKAKALQVVISVGMKVREGGEGKAVGVAVRYRQGDALKEQVFRQQIFVCSVPELVPHCPGHPDDAAVFGKFEDELRSGKGSGASR